MVETRLRSGTRDCIEMEGELESGAVQGKSNRVGDGNVLCTGHRLQVTGYYRTHTVATREIDERSSPRSVCMEVPPAGCQTAGVLIDLVEP